MDPRTAYDRRSEVQILDVREPAEWAAGHIPGALHIPMGRIPHRLNEIDRDRTVVVTCRSGRRSGQVATYLRAFGIGAENMPGGIQEWVAEGLPLQRS